LTSNSSRPFGELGIVVYPAGGMYAVLIFFSLFSHSCFLRILDLNIVPSSPAYSGDNFEGFTLSTELTVLVEDIFFVILQYNYMHTLFMTLSTLKRLSSSG
jgi:hypothetical protein